MSKGARRCGVPAALLLLAAPWAGAGPEPAEQPVWEHVRSAPVTPFVFDGDVRDLPPPRAWRPGDPVFSVPQRFYEVDAPRDAATGRPFVDPLWQLQLGFQSLTRGATVFTVPDRNFDGQAFSMRSPRMVVLAKRG